MCKAIKLVVDFIMSHLEEIYNGTITVSYDEETDSITVVIKNGVFEDFTHTEENINEHLAKGHGYNWLYERIRTAYKFDIEEKMDNICNNLYKR